MSHHYIIWNDTKFEGGQKNIRVFVPDSVETIKDLRQNLTSRGHIIESVDFITTDKHNIFASYSDELIEIEFWDMNVHTRSIPMVINQLSGLSEESDRKCRELCEEMSALKASNESEVNALKAQHKSAMDSMQTKIKDLRQNNQEVVKDLSELSAKNSALSKEMSALKATNESEVQALKAQLKSSEDSMHTMTEEINDLRQQLSSYASQEVVINLSELLAKNSALTEEMSALKARNESEVKALKAELKSAMDSMETMVTENNNLKQTVYSLSQIISYNISNQNMATDLKHKLSEMSTKYTELSEELSALKASKHIIESDVKQLAQEINGLNIRRSVSDSSSSCSSIGSHNQLTTNSDKTRDQINVCQSVLKKLLTSPRLSDSRESLPELFK